MYEKYRMSFLTPNLSNPAPVNNPLLLNNVGGNVPFTTLQNYANARTPFWETDFDNNPSTIQTGQLTLTSGVDPYDDVALIIKGEAPPPAQNAPTFIMFQDVTNTVNSNTNVIGMDAGLYSTFNGISVTQPIMAMNYGAGQFASQICQEMIFADAYIPNYANVYAGIRGDDNGNMFVGASTIALSSINTVLPTIPVTTIPGFQTGQRGTQTTRPVLVDNVSGKLTKPSQPMMRVWSVATPSATGSPVQLFDTNGNPYNADNWSIMVVGFNNVGGDRTYACFVFFDVNRNYYVQYDQAGGTGVVDLLAISNSMFMDGSN